MVSHHSRESEVGLGLEQEVARRCGGANPRAILALVPNNLNCLQGSVAAVGQIITVPRRQPGVLGTRCTRVELKKQQSVVTACLSRAWMRQDMHRASLQLRVETNRSALTVGARLLGFYVVHM